MAIDSEDKRRSVVGILPIADGTISGVDKQHVAGFYRGIAAGELAKISGVYGISYDRPSTHSRTFDKPATHSRTFDKPATHSRTYDN